MNRQLALLLSLVVGVAHAAPVTVTWEAPFGYSPTGYYLGYGETSGAYSTIVDVGNKQNYTINDLVAGRTYFVSVKAAYGAIGSSSWANEIVVAVFGDLPPPTVTVSPVVGLWSNRDEIGTGYSLDFKHGVLVVLVYSYSANDGESQWYIASGPLSGATFTSRLDKFAAGPCISCAFVDPPVWEGNDGTITIVFSSATSASVYLPGGRVSKIQPTAF